MQLFIRYRKVDLAVLEPQRWEKRSSSSALSTLALALVLFFVNPTRAADEIEISHPGNPAIPISVTGFSGEVQRVLAFDLYIAGFDLTTSAATASYKLSGADAGQVRGQLEDHSGAVLFSQQYSGGSLRGQAHALANEVTLRVTGNAGIAASRIAFKGIAGSIAEVYEADYDGANLFELTHDGVFVDGPVYGRAGMIYYTSYKSGYPDIYSHNLRTGERKIIAEHPGENINPSPSPDGKKIAMILDWDGTNSLYVADADGSNLLRLTHTKAVVASPCWSPDGKTICYVEGNVSALWLIAAAGGTPRRLVTGVSYAMAPDWSPDGTLIAFSSEGGPSIYTVPASGGAATPLAAGERPKWAANSRTLIFSNEGGGIKTLSLLDVKTKHLKTVSIALRGCSEPTWAK